MFDGLMPPSGRQPAESVWAVGSGNQSVPQQRPLVTSPTGNPVGIAEQRWPRAEPRCVQLAFPAANAGAGGFPPVQSVRFTSCGWVDSSGVVIDSAYAWLAAVIEYGCGAASQKLYCDWQPGAINIPASDFVRVSALAWGNNASYGTNPVQVQASIATGVMDGAHVPTATGSGTFAAGVPRTFSVPPGARAVGVIVADATLPTVILRGSAWGSFNFATPVFAPGTYVVDVVDAGTLQVTSSLASLLTLTWFLQP